MEVDLHVPCSWWRPIVYRSCLARHPHFVPKSPLTSCTDEHLNPADQLRKVSYRNCTCSRDPHNKSLAAGVAPLCIPAATTARAASASAILLQPHRRMQGPARACDKLKAASHTSTITHSLCMATHSSVYGNTLEHSHPPSNNRDKQPAHEPSLPSDHPRHSVPTGENLQG